MSISYFCSFHPFSCLFTIPFSSFANQSILSSYHLLNHPHKGIYKLQWLIKACNVLNSQKNRLKGSKWLTKDDVQGRNIYGNDYNNKDGPRSFHQSLLIGLVPIVLEQVLTYQTQPIHSWRNTMCAWLRLKCSQACARTLRNLLHHIHLKIEQVK